MKLIGKTLPGAVSFDLGANTKRVARYAVAQPIKVVKLSVYADGLGSGVGDQVMRGVIYDTANNLLAQGDEVLVLDEQPPGWIDLPLTVYRGGVALPAASYDFGVLGGDQPNSIRLYGDAVAAAGRTNADTYVGGASATFGSATSLDFDLAVFATYATVWAPTGIPDSEIARLPFEAAQKTLLGGAGLPVTGILGWYGSDFDEDAGSFVLVQENGKFAGQVGERLEISLGNRVVYAYCKGTAILNSDEDLAVPRRVYSALSLPTTVPIPVEIAVVA